MDKAGGLRRYYDDVGNVFKKSVLNIHIWIAKLFSMYLIHF